jgi:hypothetical protein
MQKVSLQFEHSEFEQNPIEICDFGCITFKAAREASPPKFGCSRVLQPLQPRLPQGTDANKHHAMSYHVGQRLSFDSYICTIRYIGPVEGTKDTDKTWLGVEWDDPRRGKHDGVHNGKRYFTCKCFIVTVCQNLWYNVTDLR